MQDAMPQFVSRKDKRFVSESAARSCMIEYYAGAGGIGFVVVTSTMHFYTDFLASTLEFYVLCRQIYRVVIYQREKHIHIIYIYKYIAALLNSYLQPLVILTPFSKCKSIRFLALIPYHPIAETSVFNLES